MEELAGVTRDRLEWLRELMRAFDEQRRMLMDMTDCVIDADEYLDGCKMLLEVELLTQSLQQYLDAGPRDPAVPTDEEVEEMARRVGADECPF